MSAPMIAGLDTTIKLLDADFRFFGRLRAMGIDPEVAVTDGSSLYPKVIKEVWEACKHQLCRFHWTRDVVKEVIAGVRYYRESLPKPSKRSKKGRPSKEEAAAQAQATEQQSARDEAPMRDESGC